MGRLARLVVALFLTAGPPNVWLRSSYPDAVVVQRSELIAEGVVRADSIRREEREDRSCVHHAVLSIHRILKGTGETKEIPILIHYGLTPIVRTEGPIELWDTGNSAASPRPFIEDLGKSHLWFLRRRGGVYGREASTGDLGIVDPEDVKPLDHREYLQLYLTPDPESAVRKYLPNHPEFEPRARNFLDHCDILRILSSGKGAEQARLLLPYFLKRHEWNDQDEAGLALKSLGEPAGKILLDRYEERDFVKAREDILRLWGEMAFRPAVPRLIAVVEEQLVYWEKQDLQKGWWGRQGESQLTSERYANYGLLHSALIALGKICDSSARQAVRRTRSLWIQPRFGMEQIVEECDRTLDLLGK
jgi:hypothetical protein